jgi:hypothetical protein
MSISSKIPQIPGKVAQWVRGAFHKAPSGPVLIYQMGKVGSKTVLASLRAHLPFAEIHHAHLLNHLDELELALASEMSNPRSSISEVRKGRRLREQLLQRSKPWNVITLVRDPVARNISAFFHNLTEMFPPGTSQEEIAAMGVGELCETFLNSYSHEAPISWFQNQLEPLTGIDVSCTPFDHDEKCMVVEGDRCRLLVLRMEDLNEVGAGRTAQFLGLENFRFTNANEASNKIYGEIYKNFVRNAQITDDYLDRMYGSWFARHFYRPEEIAAFRSRWTRP